MAIARQLGRGASFRAVILSEAGRGASDGVEGSRVFR